jgi:hypothetical protein
MQKIVSVQEFQKTLLSFLDTSDKTLAVFAREAHVSSNRVSSILQGKVRAPSQSGKQNLNLGIARSLVRIARYLKVDGKSVLESYGLLTDRTARLLEQRLGSGRKVSIPNEWNEQELRPLLELLLKRKTTKVGDVREGVEYVLRVRSATGNPLPDDVLERILSSWNL